jgi:hypothetical protein
MTQLLPFRRPPDEFEWVGGRYVLPQEMRDGNSIYRPVVILWLELPRGVLLGSKLSNPRSAPSFAQSLERAMQDPGEGLPRRPTRIRVADETVAKELRAAVPAIPIVVAPVPELDATFEELSAALAENAPEPSYLRDGEIAPELFETLFQAASILFRAAPWRASEQHILRVDIPALGVDGACLSIIGAAGESHGLLLFRSIDDYETFGLIGEGKAKAWRSHEAVALRSLSFDSGKDLPPSLLREIEEHRWPVAGTKAYPSLLCLGADMIPRAATENDLRITTATTRAFVAFFARHRDLFNSEYPELVRESIDEDGVTVTITAPFAVPRG